MSLLAHHHARLAALPRAPLVKQFLHDLRRDVIKYSSGWVVFNVGQGPPYRANDVALLNQYTPTNQDETIDLSFTSGGMADEYVTAAAATDDATAFEIYLNGVLVAERLANLNAVSYSPAVLALASGNQYYSDPTRDIYADYYLKIQPAYGVNHLRIVKKLNQNAGYYGDGFGLNLRGGPLPI